MTDTRCSTYKSAMSWKLAIFHFHTLAKDFRPSLKSFQPQSFTDGIIWDRDYFYAVPQLQGSRPKWRFAQIRPVTGRLWEVISPFPAGSAAHQCMSIGQ